MRANAYDLDVGQALSFWSVFHRVARHPEDPSRMAYQALGALPRGRICFSSRSSFVSLRPSFSVLSRDPITRETTD